MKDAKEFEVEMLAFGGGAIRIVDVPVTELVTPFGEADQDYILEQIFKYGQNDFQPRKFPSVSVGDVIRFKGKRFEVSFLGFKELV